MLAASRRIKGNCIYFRQSQRKPRESTSTYPDGDHQKPNVSDLGFEPLEEGAGQGHERAIRKDGNHGDDVKHVLPNADAAGLLDQVGLPRGSPR